jgi:phosphoglucosamine mutase
VLAALIQSGKPASEVMRQFEPVPQLLKNVRYSGGAPLEDARVKQAIADAEKRLGNQGRLVIRPSGTEPLVRIMAEGDDEALVHDVVGTLADVVKTVAAAA